MDKLSKVLGDALEIFRKLGSGEIVHHIEYNVDRDKNGKIYHYSIKHCKCDIKRDHGTGIK